MLKALHETPPIVAHLVAERDDRELDQARAGGWSARVIMAHLRDDEAMVMRMRLVRMLTEDNPLLPDFDENAWAANRNTGRDQKETLLGDFTLQRQASLNILRRLDEAHWGRQGRHEVNGAITVQSWVEHWVEHDREHITQLERALGDTMDAVLKRRAITYAPRAEER